jgi:hypothetical protein
MFRPNTKLHVPIRILSLPCECHIGTNTDKIGNLHSKKSPHEWLNKSNKIDQ